MDCYGSYGSWDMISFSGSEPRSQGAPLAVVGSAPESRKCGFQDLGWYKKRGTKGMAIHVPLKHHKISKGTGWSKQIGHWPISVCAWTILATCCFSRRIPCFMDGLQVAHVSWSSCFLGVPEEQVEQEDDDKWGCPSLGRPMEDLAFHFQEAVEVLNGASPWLQWVWRPSPPKNRTRPQFAPILFQKICPNLYWPH